MNQWNMNQPYPNMSQDEVDWAALAQQWIIMKESGPPPVPGEAPVNLNAKPKKDVRVEGGEAPMDVDNGKDGSPVWNMPGKVPAPPVVESWNWNNQNQSWGGWNRSWPPMNVVPAPNTMKPPLLPTPSNFQYMVRPDNNSDNATFGGYNTVQNEDNSSMLPSQKQIKPHNRRYTKVNVPKPLPPAPPVISDTSSITPGLDAAKRKQLPAWIREGLEKMEREKLKQIEKIKEKEEEEKYKEDIQKSEKEKMEILKTTMKEQRSRFESDNENSDEEPEVKKKVVAEPPPLTQEELVLKVRRTMTEILLNVTNRHIATICKEEHQRYLNKYKASDQHSSAPSRGANISAKLGLGVYGDDSGSSSDENDDEPQRNNHDSDSDLKASIKKKMADFVKTEQEIENKLSAAEQRTTKSTSRSASPDTTDYDSQVDARPQGHRSPPRRSRSPREKSQQRSPSSSYSSDGYRNNQSRSSRVSSSSDSNDSYTDSKKKYKSYSNTSSKKVKSHSKSYYSKHSRSRSPSSRRSRSRDRGTRSPSKHSSSRSYSRSRYSRSPSSKKSRRSSSRDREKRSTRYDSSRSYKKSRSSKSPSRYSSRKRSRSSSGSRDRRSSHRR